MLKGIYSEKEVAIGKEYNSKIHSLRKIFKNLKRNHEHDWQETGGYIVFISHNKVYNCLPLVDAYRYMKLYDLER